MEYDSQWVCFGMAMLALAALSQGVLCYVLFKMRSVPAATSLAELHPSELAYLLRPGDSAHCLIVLIVDILQKCLKSPASFSAEIAESHYEFEVWTAVRAYIKEWTLQKAQSLVPELITRNPIRIATGFWRLRHWISDTFKSLFNDLIKDPASLRRYFSPAGLMRVFLSLLSSGVKEPLMRKLRLTLLERNLLVSAETARQFSRYFGILCGVHILAMGLLLAYVSGVKRWETIVLLIVCTAFNGVVLRLLAVLPSFLPFYDEVSLVLDSIGRRGFRIAVLRGILKGLRTFFWSVIGLTSGAVFALQALAFARFLQLASGNWTLDFVGLALLSLNFVIVAELAVLSLRVSHTDQLSAAGQNLLRKYQVQLKNASPITAFSSVLADPQYNGELSNIVAIYGVETLFLLA